MAKGTLLTEQGERGHDIYLLLDGPTSPGRHRPVCAGRGDWCALPWPVNVSQTYDCFSAAASFALRDVRIDRLGPVHDGWCGDVQAVLGELEHALG